jgi:hypothetical protein
LQYLHVWLLALNSSQRRESRKLVNLTQEPESSIIGGLFRARAVRNQDLKPRDLNQEDAVSSPGGAGRVEPSRFALSSESSEGNDRRGANR